MVVSTLEGLRPSLSHTMLDSVIRASTKVTHGEIDFLSSRLCCLLPAQGFSSVHVRNFTVELTKSQTRVRRVKSLAQLLKPRSHSCTESVQPKDGGYNLNQRRDGAFFRKTCGFAQAVRMTSTRAVPSWSIAVCKRVVPVLVWPQAPK